MRPTGALAKASTRPCMIARSAALSRPLLSRPSGPQTPQRQAFQRPSEVQLRLSAGIFTLMVTCGPAAPSHIMRCCALRSRCCARCFARRAVWLRAHASSWLRAHAIGPGAFAVLLSLPSCAPLAALRTRSGQARTQPATYGRGKHLCGGQRSGGGRGPQRGARGGEGICSLLILAHVVARP